DSGITISWENEPDEVWGEKKNLLLASGELPDALFNSGLSDAEVAKYGANGTLLALNDLIEEHAPILRARLEGRPDIRAAITASALPLSFMGSHAICDLIAAIGGLAVTPDHRIVQDAKVHFTANTEGYRAAISVLHTWFTEGLIDQESFSQDYVKMVAKGK